MALAALATLVGLLNARRTARIVDVEVRLPNLPTSLHGFTIAQISDVHVGPTIKRRYVEAIVDSVNSLEADVIAVTGDLVDGSVKDLSKHTAPFARLSARHGAFFVTGNHEYYSGEPAWTAEFTASRHASADERARRAVARRLASRARRRRGLRRTSLRSEASGAIRSAR